MAITDLPVLSMLRDRMQWQQSRQQVLAQNVANASMPGFKPMDLAQPSSGAPGRLEMDRTSALHLASGGPGGADPARARRFETRPSGNAVNLEDEMMKVAQNQSDYQLATSLYQKSLAMLKMAAGARGGG